MSQPAANPFLAPLPPAPPSLPLPPASFGRRACALALDHLALLLCLLPGLLCTYAFALHAQTASPPPVDPAEIFGECFAASLPVFLGGLFAGACVQIAVLIAESRSLGKRWGGLRIMRPDGRRAGPLRLLFVRTPLQLLHYIPVVGKLLLLANLALALRSPGESVHDRAAGTLVVRA
jgi:uncharacterized RDD family membrane protein YckC